MLLALVVSVIAFGMVSKVVPQLNVFAVGFPITLVFGFVVELLGLPGITSVLTELLASAFGFMRALTGG